MRPQVFLSTPSGCLSPGIHKNEKQTILNEQKTVYEMAIIESSDCCLIDPHIDDQFLALARRQLGAGAAVQSELDEHGFDYSKR